MIKLASEYGFELEKTEELDSDYFENILDFTQRAKWFGRIKQTFPLKSAVNIFENSRFIWEKILSMNYIIILIL